MATVHIPSLLRDLTGNREQVEVPIPSGEKRTVREILALLEQEYPGLSTRLLDAEGELVPHLAVFIEDQPAGMGLQAKLEPEQNLFFLAPVVGGR